MLSTPTGGEYTLNRTALGLRQIDFEECSVKVILAMNAGPQLEMENMPPVEYFGRQARSLQTEATIRVEPRLDSGGCKFSESRIQEVDFKSIAVKWARFAIRATGTPDY